MAGFCKTCDSILIKLYTHEIETVPGKIDVINYCNVCKVSQEISEGTVLYEIGSNKTILNNPVGDNLAARTITKNGNEAVLVPGTGLVEIDTFKNFI